MSMQIAPAGGNPSRQIDVTTGEVRQRFVALDRYADEGYVEPQGLPTLAKISAGYKDDKRLPQVSRDGTIYLSDPDDRAPHLRAALDAADTARRDKDGKITGSMRLQIALPFDQIDDNLRQSFVRYSAGRLEAHGDLDHITELVVTEWTQNHAPAQVERHIAYRNGDVCPSCDKTHDYRALKRTCQVVWNLLFTLGEWVGEGSDAWAQPIMDDGLGVYRLTSASRKGLNDIGQYLDLVSVLCNGQLRGAVLELSLTYPPVADPLGIRRTSVPRWTVLFKPPPGIRLNPRRWRELAAGMLREGALLALPAAPSPERWEDVEQDMAELIEPDQHVLDQLVSGDLPAEPNAEYWRREYFGQVSGTSLSTDVGRARFLQQETGMAHLPEVINAFSNSQMQELVARAAEFAARERLGKPVQPKPEDRQAGHRELDAETLAKARRYDEIFGADTSVAAIPQRIEAECSGCGALGTCVQTNQGAFCVDQAACRARQEVREKSNAAAHAGAAAAEPSPQTDASPSSVDEGGRPVDTPDVQAEIDPGDMGEGGWNGTPLDRLLAELRMDTGGEIFLCGACGKAVGSVKVTRQGSDAEEVLPARAWLAELAKAGLDRPLCLADSRKELAARRKKERAS